MSTIWIAGAGAFGCALAKLFSAQGHEVHLYGRSFVSEKLEATRERLTLPIPIALEAELKPNSDDILLLAVPTQSLAQFLTGASLKPLVAISCAKGIELNSGRLPSEVISDALGCETAVLSGPSFAADIFAGLPTALTLACENSKLAAQLQRDLSGTLLRLYVTTDLTGVELGGALKNVVAIACGATIGAGFGESARAAVLTRGFAEMSRLAMAMGASSETLSGLSGLGDLALSAMSEKSRNFAFGRAMGEGKPPADVTTEGRATARAVLKLAKKHSVAMPIAETVAAVSDGELKLDEAMTRLMKRPLKKE